LSGRQARLRLRRIGVVLTGEGLDAETLERVAVLAAEAAAEMSGVFVEDSELLRLSGLPFAREISRSTSVARRLEGETVERELRVQASAAERALARVAERAGVAWRFRTARGTVTAVLGEAAGEVDLMVLGARREVLSSGALGRAAPRAGSAARRSAPVGVVYDRSGPAHRALALAARLAREHGAPLGVFVVAASQAAAERLRERARSELAGAEPAGSDLSGTPARLRRLVRPTLAALLDALEAEGAQAVVLPGTRAMLEPAALRRLGQDLSCPAFVVR